MPSKKKTPQKAPAVLGLIDEALQGIIDQWYLSVSDYYVTAEKKAENPDLSAAEELKRFHDETGHRIKFNKGELNFTYGLLVQMSPEGCRLEVSVNNKVPDFNYGELVRRLSAYYDGARVRAIEGFRKPRKLRNCDLFALPTDLQTSVTVEQREGKADILRLTFGVATDHLDDLASESAAFMDSIHQ